jgi:hypothetical protein
MQICHQLDNTQFQFDNLIWEPVAHACYHSYSGGRDQKDGSSKPAGANSWREPISKTANTKKQGWRRKWLKV